jgi:hypothetical protein
VADTDHQDQEYLVFDFVEDAVLSHSHPIAVFLTLVFLDSDRPGNLRELVDRGANPAADRDFQFAEIPQYSGA